MFMFVPPPPTPPFLPAYPEPERSRLEAAYRDEHDAYCKQLDLDILCQVLTFFTGFAAVAAFVMWSAYA